MADGIRVRLAELTDAEGLHALNVIFNGQGGSPREITEALLLNVNEIVCVACSGGKLVGFCCGLVMMRTICYGSDYGEITELFVLEGFRRFGAGKGLIEMVESEFIKRGVTHIHLSTGMENYTARRFYESLGYRDMSEMVYEKNLPIGGDKAALTTERLLIRPFRPGDWRDMLEYLSLAEVPSLTLRTSKTKKKSPQSA